MVVKEGGRDKDGERRFIYHVGYPPLGRRRRAVAVSLKERRRAVVVGE